ncbi:DUF3768 domain-containing protein [Roseovarius sp. 2305UL8-3]|uniref:DUF3768 domain-containing protein n=1 Tax=Roseovarius conchicola TaxID=3121636 RepID=UPI003529CAC0
MGTLQENTEEDIGAVPRCKTCGSERVAKDAWACWNPESGLWELENVFDAAHCHQCEDSTKLVWSRQEVPPHQRIRELNDRFRRDGVGNGSVMLTIGIQERGSVFAVAAVQAVRSFEAFSEDNDPWGEHDFGAVQVQGEKVFWKIDYYTPDLSAGSENPANEGITHRVLTIMLPTEY